MANERNFLNRKEIELTGLVLASKEYSKIYINCEYLNEFEKRKLTNAIKNLQELETSLFARTEKVYLKRLKSLLDKNDLSFYPRGLNRNKIVEEVDNSIIEQLIQDSAWAMECIDCDRSDYENCSCYKVMASVGKEPTNYKGGCPFK